MKKIGILKTFASSEIEKSRVSIGFEGLDRELFNPDKCYDLIGKTGVKYARCQTGWARCEKQKGIYDFGWLDSVVDNLIERGIEPWFNVGYGNPVYMENVPNQTAVGCVPLSYGEECADAWKRFVRALAEHFGGRVKIFEIWNEPESENFWYPEKPDAAEYAKLFKITSAEVLKVLPDAKIGACTSSAYDFSYIEELLANIKGEKLDFFSYHTHSMLPELCENQIQPYLKNIKFMRSLLDSYGFRSCELWQGEAGHPSWAPKGHWLMKDGCDDERAQAVWQLRRLFLDFYAGASLSSFFMAADIWEKPYEMAQSGYKKGAANGILHGLVYTPKKSYETFSHLCALFSGDITPSDYYIAGETSELPVTEQMACVFLSFEKNASPLYVYYMPYETSEKFRVDTFKTYVYKALKEPVLLDMYTGEIFEIGDVSMLKGMTVYSGLPLTNYPMVICEKNLIM